MGEARTSSNNRNTLLAIGGGLSAAAAGLIVAKSVMGSPSPAYRQALRRYTPTTISGPLDWPQFEANPDAGRLPRSWSLAGVLGVDQDEYKELLAERRDGRCAYAYMTGDDVKVIAVPGGCGRIQQDGQNLIAVAGRVRNAPLTATLGVYMQECGTLVVPDKVFAVDRLPVSEVSSRYPRVPLV